TNRDRFVFMAGYTDSVGWDVGWYWLASDCWSWNAGWHRIHHVVVHRQSGLRRWPRARDSEDGYSRGFRCLRYRRRDCSREATLDCSCLASYRRPGIELNAIRSLVSLTGSISPRLPSD